MNNSTSAGSTATTGASTPKNPASITSINSSLKNYRVETQQSASYFDSWLIYRDGNGQLCGWITETALKTFEACILRTDHANNFQTFRGLDTYQDALNYVLFNGLGDE